MAVTALEKLASELRPLITSIISDTTRHGLSSAARHYAQIDTLSCTKARLVYGSSTPQLCPCFNLELAPPEPFRQRVAVEATQRWFVVFTVRALQSLARAVLVLAVAVSKIACLAVALLVPAPRHFCCASANCTDSIPWTHPQPRTPRVNSNAFLLSHTRPASFLRATFHTPSSSSHDFRLPPAQIRFTNACF